MAEQSDRAIGPLLRQRLCLLGLCRTGENAGFGARVQRPSWPWGKAEAVHGAIRVSPILFRTSPGNHGRVVGA